MLFSCGTESFQKIPKRELLSDNSSKVWIVKSEKENGSELAAILRQNKTCYTFYRDNSVVKNKLENFGSVHYEEGSFRFIEEGEVLTLTFDNEFHKFMIHSFSQDKLLLKEIQKDHSIELIPLDKPN